MNAEKAKDEIKVGDKRYIDVTEKALECDDIIYFILASPAPTTGLSLTYTPKQRPHFIRG